MLHKGTAAYGSCQGLLELLTAQRHEWLSKPCPGRAAAPHREESETTIVAAAAGAATMRRSSGSSGEPCGRPQGCCVLLLHSLQPGAGQTGWPAEKQRCLAQAITCLDHDSQMAQLPSCRCGCSGTPCGRPLASCMVLLTRSDMATLSRSSEAVSLL